MAENRIIVRRVRKGRRQWERGGGRKGGEGGGYIYMIYIYVYDIGQYRLIGAYICIWKRIDGAERLHGRPYIIMYTVGNISPLPPPSPPGPPLLGHDVGFLTLGPKLDPLLNPPPLLLVDLRWTPVADPGCVCVTGVITPTPLECGWRHTGNAQGGGVLVNVQEWGWNVDDITRTMSKGLWKILYPRLDPPPPFQKSWIRPCMYMYIPLSSHAWIGLSQLSHPVRGRFHSAADCNLRAVSI